MPCPIMSISSSNSSAPQNRASAMRSTTLLVERVRSLRNVKWFEVIEIRGGVTDGKASHYQVTLKVGFTLEAD